MGQIFDHWGARNGDASLRRSRVGIVRGTPIGRNLGFILGGLQGGCKC